MAYLIPAEFVTKMVDAGESKIVMSTRDTLIRAFMAGAILGLAAVFAVTVSVQTGSALAGAMLFPVGFIMLYLMGFDLLTGVFVLTPLAWLDKRPGVTIQGILRNWGLVFCGNFAGAVTVALMMAFVFTMGFDAPAGPVGEKLAGVGEARTLGYAEHGVSGWFTIFLRGMLCNWMVSMGVVGAMISTNVSGKVIAMWMPIMLFCGEYVLVSFCSVNGRRFFDDGLPAVE
jgi:formate/nitrite transporter FocA (FNT family)